MLKGLRNWSVCVRSCVVRYWGRVLGRV